MVKSYNFDKKHQHHQPTTFAARFGIMFCLKYLMEFYSFTHRFLIEVVHFIKLAQSRFAFEVFKLTYIMSKSKSNGRPDLNGKKIYCCCTWPAPVLLHSHAMQH